MIVFLSISVAVLIVALIVLWFVCSNQREHATWLNDQIEALRFEGSDTYTKLATAKGEVIDWETAMMSAIGDDGPSSVSAKIWTMKKAIIRAKRDLMDLDVAEDPGEVKASMIKYLNAAYKEPMPEVFRKDRMP